MTMLKFVAVGGVAVLLGVLAWWRLTPTDIDSRIHTVQRGAFVGDVVEVLGVPNGGAWRRRPDTGELVFVYEGRRPYSIRFRAGYSTEIAEGRMAGLSMPPFNRPATEVELPEQ